MKFAEGLMLGGLITAGAMIVCSEGVDETKKKMLKKGKTFLRGLGL